MNKPAFSETVPNELRELGYVPPIIKSYDKDGINVWLDSRKKIHNVFHILNLFVLSGLGSTYCPNTNIQIFP